MKQMKKWHLGYALQLAVLFLMCTGMAACSDEETSDNLYSVGFETLQSDNTEFMAEMKEIETIFYGELGITDSSFRLNGDQAECDAQVKAACERAATRLNQRQWSFDFPIYYSPYDITPERKLRLLAIQPEVRWWTKEAGEGHFLGLHTHVAGFNIAINDNGRYQDPNHAAWGIGLSYGYQMALGRKERWAVEFNLGAGFAEYSYDAYRNWENGPRYHSGKGWHWGITRAGISFSYKWFKQRKR